MPQTSFTSYALLGAGKLAHHFAFYLNELNLPFSQWKRGDADLEARVAGASHILFALSDGAISEVASRFLSTRQMLVHFSGAVVVSGVHAAHPLMTFGPELQNPDWYRSIPFVLDEGDSLDAILPGLDNPFFTLAREKRALYHSLCSLAGNSTFLLWQKIGQRFEQELGLPRTVLTKFLHQVVENVAASTDSNFTGPVARGDWATVENHLRALETDRALLKTYKNYLHLSESSGVKLPEVLK